MQDSRNVELIAQVAKVTDDFEEARVGQNRLGAPQQLGKIRPYWPDLDAPIYNYRLRF